MACTLSVVSAGTGVFVSESLAISRFTCKWEFPLGSPTMYVSRFIMMYLLFSETAVDNVPMTVTYLGYSFIYYITVIVAKSTIDGVPFGVPYFTFQRNNNINNINTQTRHSLFLFFIPHVHLKMDKGVFSLKELDPVNDPLL